jgi:two-component system response regulator MtrA
MKTDLDAANQRAPSRVLLADADPHVLRQTNTALISAGFVVAEAADAQRALSLLTNQRFDLLVLDSTLFGADGVAVCSAIRCRSGTPLIVSSASGAEADVVRALNLGADDYVMKPLQQRTLLARINALLRRSAKQEPSVLGVDGTVLDSAAQELANDGMRVPLTRLETILLRALLASPGRAVSAERLAMEAWGKVTTAERHALKQVIYRLRRKLANVPQLAGCLQTARSAGYRWRKDDGVR